MTPRRRDSFVPATPSFPSRTLEELSELKSTFQVPGIAGCVASETTEIQGHSAVVCYRKLSLQKNDTNS